MTFSYLDALGPKRNQLFFGDFFLLSSFFEERTFSWVRVCVLVDFVDLVPAVPADLTVWVLLAEDDPTEEESCVDSSYLSNTEQGSSDRSLRPSI